MKGDFTRDTFHADKHFSRVLMQQGRVQLDADWNEMQAIVQHYVRTLTKDIFGAHSGPASGLGFKISVRQDEALLISPGHYYVDGILCENVGVLDASNGRGPISYTEQPHYPLTEDEAKKDRWITGRRFVYLDVWERFVSSLDDDDIREKALGTVETCGRAQVVWQVKLVDAPAGEACDDLLKYLPKTRKPLLRVRLKEQVAYNDPCITSPESKYRGGNQLYRIEVHAVNEDGSATFKWSRENGSVVTRFLSAADNTITLGSARGFEANAWVELTDDRRILRGEPGDLRRVVQMDGETLTLEEAEGDEPFDVDAEFHPQVRRWDQKATEKQALEDGAVPTTTTPPGGWIEIENGIEVQFERPTDAVYHVGDYWLIPARTATGDIEWPRDDKGDAVAVAPQGIQHYYAPLAILSNRSVESRCQFMVKGTREPVPLPRAARPRRSLSGSLDG